jgi:hypothetical protein
MRAAFRFSPASVLRLTALLGLVVASAGAVDRIDFVLQDRLRRAEPFPESRLQLNPTPFRWLAVEGAVSYRLEWARTPDFHGANAVTVTEPFWLPLQPLEPGVWYWRTRVEAPSPGAWTASEQFEMPAGLPRRTLRPWTEYLANIPADHPRAYVRSSDLPALRAKAARLGRELDHWKASVRAKLEKRYSLSDYESKVPAGAEKETPGHPARKLLIWASKEAAYDLAKPIADAAWIWLATGDPWFLEAARERTLLAARMDPDGFISEKFSDFGNASMVANVGLAYDFLHDEFTPAEQAIIREALTQRARPIFARMAGASQHLMRGHDWQHAYLDALTGALALHGEVPEAAAWVDLGLRTFAAFYPWFGGNDGGSFEGLKYYHGTEMIPSLNTLDFFRNAFGLALDEINPWFRANPDYLIYGFPPGSVWARLGDTVTGETDDDDNAAQPRGRARLAAARMAELYGHGHAAAYAADLPEENIGFTVGEFLRWSEPKPVEPEPLTTLPPSRLFSDIGVVFTHSDYTRPENNVRFVFHAGPYGAFGHGHADQNSFHIIVYNEDLLIDSGYFTPAGDPHRQRWTIQTPAHNTLLVDGKGQPYGDNRGHAKVRHYEAHDRWVYWIGAAEHAYPEAPLERFDRHVVWLRGDDVETYLIFDDIRSADEVPRTFDWMLHAPRRMEVDEAQGRIVVRGERGEATVTLVEPQALAFRQDDDFGGHPAVYWRNNQNYPLPNQWHLKATPAPSVEQRFLAVVQVSKPGVPKPAVRAVEGGADIAGWMVRFDPTTQKLTIQPSP